MKKDSSGIGLQESILIIFGLAALGFFLYYALGLFAIFTGVRLPALDDPLRLRGVTVVVEELPTASFKIGRYWSAYGTKYVGQDEILGSDGTVSKWILQVEDVSANNPGSQPACLPSDGTGHCVLTQENGVTWYILPILFRTPTNSEFLSHLALFSVSKSGQTSFEDALFLKEDALNLSVNITSAGTIVVSYIQLSDPTPVPEYSYVTHRRTKILLTLERQGNQLVELKRTSEVLQ